MSHCHTQPSRKGGASPHLSSVWWIHYVPGPCLCDAGTMRASVCDAQLLVQLLLNHARNRLAAMHVSVQPEQWGACTIQGQASLGLNCAAARREGACEWPSPATDADPAWCCPHLDRPVQFGCFDRVVLLVTGRGLLLDEERCRPLGVCLCDTAGLLAWRWRSFLGHHSASPRPKFWRSFTDKWDGRTGTNSCGVGMVIRPC